MFFRGKVRLSAWRRGRGNLLISFSENDALRVERESISNVLHQHFEVHLYQRWPNVRAKNNKYAFQYDAYRPLVARMHCARGALLRGAPGESAPGEMSAPGGNPGRCLLPGDVCSRGVCHSPL